MKNNKLSFLLFAFFFLLLTMVDIISTHYVISQGVGYEANPIMRLMVVNLIIFVVLKVAVVIVIVVMMNKYIVLNKNVAVCGMRIIVLIMSLVVANNLFVMSGSAVVGSINTTEDATVYNIAPNTNYGTLQSLCFGRYYTEYDNEYYRAFIKFDVSGITSLSNLNAYVNIYKNGGGVSTQYQVYRVTGSFNESTVTWNNQPAFSTVNGTVFQPTASNSWNRINITNIVKDNYPNSFLYILLHEYTSTDFACLSSKESVWKPYLNYSYDAAPDYNNTNTIIMSSTTNYNTTINSSNINNSFIVTTWIDNSTWNSDWSWWGWLLGTDFYVYYTDPTGHDSYDEYVYGQSAYQFNTTTHFTPRIKNSGLYGNFTFKMKRFNNNTVIKQATITMVNDSAVAPPPPLNEIHFSVPSHSNNSDPNIFVITSSSLLFAQIDVRYQYWNPLTNLYDGPNHSLIWVELLPGDGYVLSIGEYIVSTNYFGNQSVKITATLTNEYIMHTVSSDYIYFQASGLPATPTPTPTPTLPPTPYPTANFTPIPTATDFNPPENFSNQSTEEIFANASNVIGGIGSGVANYSTGSHKSVIGSVMPSVISAIPYKIIVFGGYCSGLVVLRYIIKGRKRT